jgi:hypothetical protein
MTNDKNRSESEVKNTLSEQELEGVSGGFTLLDTCQNRWAPAICVDALWGICPNLSMKETGKRVGNFNNVIYYKVSCDKGCFKDVDYSDHLSV